MAGSEAQCSTLGTAFHHLLGLCAGRAERLYKIVQKSLALIKRPDQDALIAAVYAIIITLIKKALDAVSGDAGIAQVQAVRRAR